MSHVYRNYERLSRRYRQRPDEEMKRTLFKLSQRLLRWHSYPDCVVLVFQNKDLPFRRKQQHAFNNALGMVRIKDLSTIKHFIIECIKDLV